MCDIDTNVYYKEFNEVQQIQISEEETMNYVPEKFTKLFTNFKLHI